MASKEKVLLEEVINNSDMNIPASDELIILDENLKYIDETTYEQNFKVQIITSAGNNDISKENFKKKSVFRQIAQAERPAVYDDEMTMTDTEFMNIITGTTRKKQQQYKRESNIIFMNKFLDRLYRP